MLQTHFSIAVPSAFFISASKQVEHLLTFPVVESTSQVLQFGKNSPHDKHESLLSLLNFW